MWQEQGHASIDHLFPPSQQTHSLKSPKVIAINHLGLFFKMNNFYGRSLCQGCSSWSLGSILVYLLYGQIQYLILIVNIFDFSHYNLYLLYLVILLQHFFYHVCCISCLVVVSLFAILIILLQHLFIMFIVLNIILAKLFLPKFSSLFVITCFTFDTN